MNLVFETKGTNTYLVYKVGEQDLVDSMTLGMLANNNIPGLIKTHFVQMDNQKYIKFNVSSKVSVGQYFTGAVNKKRLLGVFTGIVNAMLAAEDYMLDPASIILDLEYIFTDVSTCETDLICIPILDTEVHQPDMGLFFRNIMFHTQFDQTENCDYVAKIINYLNGNPLFSLNDFKKLLEQLQGENTKHIIEKQNVLFPSHDKKLDIKPPVNRKKEEQQPQSTLLSVKTPPIPIKSSVEKYLPDDKTHMDKALEKKEQEISFLYLMQHYNKENAAAYKAQKEAKKGSSSADNDKKGKRSSDKKKNQSEKQTPSGFGFNVPGQSAPVSNTMEPTENEKPSVVVHQKYVRDQKPELFNKQVPDTDADYYGETMLLENDNSEETGLIDSSSNTTGAKAYLIRIRNNEKIDLNKPIFKIGKTSGNSDYCIDDNKAISRSHAHFVERNGEYCVIDAGSMNHTYLNGVMIRSNVETKIKHGDKIRLANEDFEFKVY